MIRSRRLSLAGAAALFGAAIVAVVVIAVIDASALPHGYFAAWLVAISLPLGALPLLMLMDLFGIREEATARALRLLLASLPVVALLVIPALFDLRHLFPWGGDAALASPGLEGYKGLAKSWFTPGAFSVRAIVFLLIWTVMALFFVRPTPPSSRHVAAAGIGLTVHLVIGTLAAYDWYMSLDQAFTSSAYGIVVMSMQCAFALTVAVLMSMVAVGRGFVPSRFAILALLVAGFAALYAQGSHFLVIWSANLPKEIAWYQARWGTALAVIFVVAVPVLAVGGYALLMPRSLNRHRPLVGAGLILLALVELLYVLCLASPRGTFSVPDALLDLAFLVVLAGFGSACAAMLGGRAGLRGEPGVRHG